MSTAREFIDFWMQNSIHAAEQYGAPGASQRAGELAARCIEMAAAQGISEADLEAEVGDLTAYVRSGLEGANLKEDARKDKHRK